jgi:N-acetylneuraminic acid mutarotase
MKYIVLLFFIITGSAAHAQNEWNKLEAFGGSKRERAVGFAIGSRGYIGTGQDTAELMRRDFWEFDPGTNSWTQKADFGGIGRRNAVGFSIGTKGYIGTGMDNSEAYMGNTLNDFWEYDPVTNTWTQRAPYPGAGGAGIYYATGFGANGKGYICCGKIGPSYYSSEMWEYNPANNSWVQRPNFPGGVRYGLTSFVINNKGYVGTGTDENAFTQDFWCYDPSTNSWTAKASFPGSARFSCSTFTLGVRGFLVFGSDGGYKDELWQYNSLDNTWLQRADYMGGARRSAVAFAIGNKGYAGTGKGATGCRRDFWEYNADVLLGMDDNIDNGTLSFYPNPAIGSTTLSLPSALDTDKLSIYIYDNTGRMVSSNAVDSRQYRIDCSGLARGIYYCVLRDAQHVIATGKLITQ